MSSDSSEDEDLSKFREAADPHFIKDSMFTKKEDPVEPPCENLPSLRRSKDEDEQFNLFRVTPEFRTHVAKHLSKTLDKMYKLTETKNGYMKPKRRKGGIRLLRNSPHFIKLESKTSTEPPARVKTTAPLSDEDEDKFRAVAVSPEDILSKRETEAWSKRSKAPVYTYIKTKDGLVLK